MTPGDARQACGAGHRAHAHAAADNHAAAGADRAPRDADVAITRDHQYGPDARNRLDIHRKGTAPRSAGAGVRARRRIRDGRQDLARLALLRQHRPVGSAAGLHRRDAHLPPCASQPLALRPARTWRWPCAGCARTSPRYGGDPDRIFLLGQSAGAVHVAAYTAHPQFHGEGGAGHRRRADDLGHLRPHDAAAQPVQPRLLRRFRRQRWPKRAARPACWQRKCRCCSASASSIRRISRTRPRSFPRPGMPPKAAIRRWNTWPGHNHLSPAQCIGSSEDDLGPRIARFIAAASPPLISGS